MNPWLAIAIAVACIVAAYFLGRRDGRADRDREFVATLRRWGLQ